MHLVALSFVLNAENSRHVQSCFEEGVLLVYIWKSEFRQMGHLRSLIFCPPSSANETVFPQTSQHFSQYNHHKNLLQVSLHMFHVLMSTAMVRLFDQQSINKQFSSCYGEQGDVSHSKLEVPCWVFIPPSRVRRHLEREWRASACLLYQGCLPSTVQKLFTIKIRFGTFWRGSYLPGSHLMQKC